MAIRTKMRAFKPLIVFRVGYMKSYDGAGDITGGGTYVQEHGEGGEMWNFRVEGGYCYGFVMTRNLTGIDLYRLAPETSWRKGDELDDVDIVFIAKKPGVGQVVIGWYKNATVFHKTYLKRRGKKKRGDWEKLHYLCQVGAENAILLPEDERIFEVPYAPVHGSGWPGNANVWYAEPREEKVVQFLLRLRKYIGSPRKPSGPNVKRRGKAYPNVPDKRLITRIEQAAYDITWKYYLKNGYIVTPVYKDNRGWDLEASKDGEFLKLEVKGHLGNVIQFELTPNEYTKLKEFNKTYRVCVVRRALDKADLAIFSPKYKNGRWCLVSSLNKETIFLSERTGARAQDAES
jgi:hypothetical protein